MERVYDSEMARMQDIIDNSKVAREVTQATKRREKLQKSSERVKVNGCEFISDAYLAIREKANFRL